MAEKLLDWETGKPYFYALMDDNERQRLWDAIAAKEKQLKQAENSAAFWRYLFVASAIFVLLVIVSQSGCFGSR